MANLLDILELMKSCIPWGTMKLILTSHGISKSTGWNSTIAKIDKDLSAPEQEQQRKEIENKLKNSLIEFLYCGNKDFRVYTIEDADLVRVKKYFDSEEVTENLFSINYPVPEPEISNLLSTEAVIADKKKSEGMASISICSVRHYEETIVIQKSELSPDAIEHHNLDEDTKIFAKKMTKRQFYDVVSFDENSKTIQIRIDSRGQVAPNQIIKYFHQIESFINKSITKSSSAPFILNNRLNLFPVIEKLYKSSIGRVCELGFLVDSGSIKSEKARKNPEADIRTDTFHAAGRDAVSGAVSPFRIAVEWHFRDKENDECFPELMLPGAKKSLYEPLKHPLTIGHIKGCLYEEDFKKITTQIISFKNE